MLTMNKSLDAGKTIEMQNGATRTTLMVINKTGFNIEKNVQYDIEVGYLAKGNHRFYFLNTPKHSTANKTQYLFIDGDYGVDVKAGSMIRQDSSVGGYGNSESTITLSNEDGTILYCHSYKDRNTGWYFLLKDGKIEELSPEEATLMLYAPEVEIL